MVTQFWQVDCMEESLPEPDLLCPFCNLLKDGAVVTKCCLGTACRCCVEEAASKGESCIVCGGSIVHAALRPDPDMQRRVDHYRRANPMRGICSRSNMGRHSLSILRL